MDFYHRTEKVGNAKSRDSEMNGMGMRAFADGEGKAIFYSGLLIPSLRVIAVTAGRKNVLK